MAFTVICMDKNINLRDVELKLRFDNLHITIEQVDYGVFHDSIMRHSHSKNYYEAHLICGGKGTLIADEEEYPLEKGSLFMTGPDVVHAQITDSQDLLEEYCLGFEVKKPKKSCDSEASKALLDTKFWIGKDSGNGETLFEMLSAESQTRSIGYQNNIKNIISSILVVLIRAYTGNSVSTEITSALSDDRRINIIDYMFLYKYSTVTRDELAKKLNLSQRQLHRILLKQYGKTFSELKSEARLNKARELLQNGKTYEEAATAVGYSDMRSFLKLIKKK